MQLYAPSGKTLLSSTPTHWMRRCGIQAYMTMNNVDSFWAEPAFALDDVEGIWIPYGGRRG